MSTLREHLATARADYFRQTCPSDLTAWALRQSTRRSHRRLMAWTIAGLAAAASVGGVFGVHLWMQPAPSESLPNEPAVVAEAAPDPEPLEAPSTWLAGITELSVSWPESAGAVPMLPGLPTWDTVAESDRESPTTQESAV